MRTLFFVGVLSGSCISIAGCFGDLDIPCQSTEHCPVGDVCGLDGRCHQVGEVPAALSLEIRNGGGGIITSNPSGIQCGSKCNAAFAEGSSVSLVAEPAPGFRFRGWSGDASCTDTSACTVTMNGPKTVTATFEIERYPLRVDQGGTGGGNVVSDPAGIDCPGTCSSDFMAGSSVTLAATADANARFVGWTGTDCPGTSACVVAMNGAKNVTATFDVRTHPLTVTRTGAGIGAITSTPDGIDCSGAASACAAAFSENTGVLLQAAAEIGSVFTGWTGDGCSGTRPCAITMDRPRSVAANFATARSLIVLTLGDGAGTVQTTPVGIDCPGNCTGAFELAIGVEVVATPDATSTFVGWDGACRGQGSCFLTMDAEQIVSATFDTIRRTVSVRKEGSGGGTVVSTAGELDCGPRCDAVVPNATPVSISARPDSNSTFLGWAGDCTGRGACDVTASSDIDVVAMFASPGHFWSGQLGGIGNDLAYSAAVDADGNVLVAGVFEGSVDFGGGALTSAGAYDAFLAKFSNRGVHLWSRRFGGPSYDAFYGIAVSASGEVAATGAFSGVAIFGGSQLTSAGGTDVVTAKFDSTGAHLWSEGFGANGNDEGLAIAFDPSGDVFFSGDFSGSASFGGSLLVSAGNEDIFLSKYSGSGSHLWSMSAGGPSADHSFSVAADPSGNVLVTGEFLGIANFGGTPLVSSGNGDIFVAKYSPVGVHVASRAFGGSGGDRGFQIAADTSDRMYLTGYFTDVADFGTDTLTSLGFEDMFVARLAATLDVEWARGFGGQGVDFGTTLSVDDQDAVVVGGAFEGSANFGGGDLTSSGGSDIFIAKYARADGSHLLSAAYGGNAADLPWGVVSRSNGTVLAGVFDADLRFGGSDLNTYGGSDVFVAKLRYTDGDTCSTAVFLPVPSGSRGTFALAFDTTPASDLRNDYAPACLTDSGGPDLVFAFTLTTSTAIRFESSGFDSVLSVHSGSCEPGRGGGDVACNDDGGTNFGSLLETTLPLGTYFLTIDAYDQGGPGTLDVTLSDPAVSTLAAGQAEPRGVVVDTTTVYWTNSSVTGEIMQAPSVGGSATPLASNLDRPWLLARGAGNVYWTEATEVRFAPIQSLDASVVLASEQSDPGCIVVSDSFVYWANGGDGTIMRASINGETPPEVISWGGTAPFCVAVDGTYIYWTDAGTGLAGAGTVHRMRLSGGAPTTLASGQSNPGYIAVDSTHVYWTNIAAPGAVMSVAIAGGAPSVLADGEAWPFDLAVDGYNVYWTNNVGGTVKKVPVTGGPPLILIGGQAGPMGLDVDASGVYWTNFDEGTVMRLSPK